MDDARCWMRAKQRGAPGLTMSESGHNLNTYAQPTQHHSYDSSWEEKAFAEDAAGPLGGCIWPPRSYSCNFCGRVFRSAQALGGHMNVHRRDRARLKQSIIPQDSFDHHQPSHQLQHSKKPFVALHVPSHLAYSPNPNPISFEIPAPSSLALKISSSSATQYISIDQEPTFVQLGLREYRSSNTPKRPGSKNMVVADQNIQTSDLARKGGSQILKDLGEKALMHCVKPDISVNLNLFLFQTRANNNESGEDDYEDDEVGDNMSGSKRRKLTADESSTMSSSYIKSSIVDRLDVQQKLFPARRSPSSSIQELDLELRLGERPKVK